MTLVKSIKVITKVKNIISWNQLAEEESELLIIID